MEKEWNVELLFLEQVDSTQLYLKKKVASKELCGEVAVVAKKQTDGIGSRKNSWQGVEGNLFLSFSIPLENLPKDLKLESASIYFSYLLLEVLRQYGSKAWLKWPNDFYIEKKKFGGMITNLVENHLVCGVGLNLTKSVDMFGVLDVELKSEELVEQYFSNIKKKVSWKQVFSKYKLEFHKNTEFFTHINGVKTTLKNATLKEDGSLSIDGERIYSLR